MPIYKRKSTGKWYIKFDLNGQTYYHTPKIQKTKRALELHEAKMKAAILAGAYKPPTQAPRLADFLREVYLPWARLNKARSGYDDERVCAAIPASLGKLRLHELTPKLLREYQATRAATATQYGRARKASSVNRELSILSRALSLAVQEELLKENPLRQVERLRGTESRIRWLSGDEETRLLDALTGPRAHLRPLVVIALHTGMRRGELLSLRRHQIDFEKDTLTLTHTKTTKRTGKGRVIPLNSIARAELLSLASELGELEYVFRRKTSPMKHIKNGFTAACEAAGIRNFRFHDLRHTFGTRLAEAGEPLHRIAELMGHADIKMTARYVHAIAAGKHAAVERLVTNRCEIVAAFDRKAS